MPTQATCNPKPILVFVTDPVAHTITTWVTGPGANKVASVVKVPAEKPTTKAAPTQIHQDNRPQPIITTEDLGTDSLQGLPVSVVKTTTIVPAGRSGNDAPITKTHEVWTSADMKQPLPAGRFTVSCTYSIDGMVRAAAIRFASTAPFDRIGKTIPVGALSDCTLRR